MENPAVNVRPDRPSSIPDPAESDPRTEAGASPEAEGAEPPLPDPDPANEPATGPQTPAGGPAATIDFRDRWLRAEAELQNFRRRSRRDLEETSRFAEESVMLEIIGALDDLDRAVAAAREAGSAESLAQGVELVAARLREYLARQGVTLVDPVGEPFDPAFHEALLDVEAPDGVRPGHVVQVALKGYRRGPRALRAARVVVARAAPEREA